MKSDLEQRITFNPRQCGGQPCIRGLRIRVTDILEMLAQGVDQDVAWHIVVRLKTDCNRDGQAGIQIDY